MRPMGCLLRVLCYGIKIRLSTKARIMTDLVAPSTYDITIVGSGMVGCVLAIALSPMVDSILLFDRHLIDIDRKPNLKSSDYTECKYSSLFKSVRCLAAAARWRAD